MNEEEFKQYKKDHIKYGIKESDYSYFSYWYLDNAEVLDYDYIRDYTETLFVLTGWYHIYILDGKVYFIFSNVQNYD